MVPRPLWVERVYAAWRHAPIVWLSGVRRVGKTTLASALPEALMVNCDLPSSGMRLTDPEAFFASVRKPILWMPTCARLGGFVLESGWSVIMMAFIKFHPESKNRGFAELLWAKGGAFHCLPEGIYDVSEADLFRLKEKGIPYEFVSNGFAILNGKRQSSEP